jgi:fructose-bisphosphate aldolase, class II
MQNVDAILRKLSKHNKAVPAFNVPYLPMVEPVVQAVVDQNSFALIETARLEWYKFGAGSAKLVAEEYAKWRDPQHVRLHLDHIPVIDEDGIRVNYLDLIREAIDLGYDSAMVDGSRLSFQENIQVVKTVAQLTHAAGIPCEAELGSILGHESGPLPPYEEIFNSGKGFTDLEEAKKFVEETECDWLSVAIGSIHGAITGVLKDQKKPAARLNLEHLGKLHAATGIPLVLHGGSGIPREYVLESFKLGIAKINIGMEIRQAFENAVRETNHVATAQKAVYDRTTWLLGEYFDLKNDFDLINSGE